MPTQGSVTIDYDAWIAQNPAMAQIGEQAFAGVWLPLASLWFDTIGWPGSLPQAPALLGLLTAHVAYLFSMRDAQGRPSDAGTVPPPVLVGRISSASQGSVSVQAEFEANQNPSASWYLQSPYGAAYWQATSQFRTGFYVGGPQRARRAAAASYIFPRFPLWR